MRGMTSSMMMRREMKVKKMERHSTQKMSAKRLTRNFSSMFFEW